MRVAVVTDAVSERFLFPHWLRYYSNLFGRDNIFIVTYPGIAARLPTDCGGIIQLPVGYDDDTRRRVISGLVSSLLTCYDFVIRVDTDEFLVVDPRVATDLIHFISMSDFPYITARGFDVIQLADEPALDINDQGPILESRRFAYPNSALCKTCVVSTDVSWSNGFHAANVFPSFGPLFMLHLKRVDVNWQVQWYSEMRSQLRGNANVPDSLHQYYSAEREAITTYHSGVESRPRLFGLDSWYRSEHIGDFLKSTRLAKEFKTYYSDYDHERVLCEIIPEWRSLF